jgi:BolA protein
MNRIDRIKNTLEKELNPTLLKITDDSERHIGHRGNKGGEHTHLNLNISANFGDKKLVECHRYIKHLIKDEFDGGLHAISIKIESSCI